MADCSVGGVSLVRGRLVLKRRGNWTAYLDEIGGSTAPSGQVTLNWLGTSCSGTVLRSGTADTSVQAYMVGGKGGGARPLPPKMYDYQIPVSMILTAILRDAGEAQSPLIDQTLLDKTLGRYVRRAGNLGQQLDQLADKLGVTWRVLLDGSVWLGVDAWQPAASFPHVLSEGWAPASGCVPLLPETIGLLPGQLYTGPAGGPAVSVYCGEIVYSVTPEQSSATLYALSSQALTAEGRLSQSLRSVIREELAPLDWYKTYSGRVIQQRGDGSLDIEIDGDTPLGKVLPALTSVSYRVIPAGAKLSVKKDSRCDVIFENGSDDRAVALLYQPGAGGHPAARQGDGCGWLIIQYALDANSLAFVASVTYSTTNPGPLPPPQHVIPLTITSGSPDISLP